MWIPNYNQWLGTPFLFWGKYLFCCPGCSWVRIPQSRGCRPWWWNYPPPPPRWSGTTAWSGSKNKFLCNDKHHLAVISRTSMFVVYLGKSGVTPEEVDPPSDAIEVHILDYSKTTNAIFGPSNANYVHSQKSLVVVINCRTIGLRLSD